MPLFPLGTIDIAPGAAAVLAAAGVDPAVFLARHQNGDWGEADEQTQRENSFAVEHAHAIFSEYKLSDNTELLVITADNRSFTRVLLAAEWDTREVSTQEGYDLWAVSYDQEKNPLIALEEPYVDALVTGLPITSALDVGTGTGRHALKLARHGVAVTAIDQSPKMLAVARRAAQNEGLTIDFRLMSLGGDLPFDTGQFDFLISALMLCHVANLAQAIEGFARVLCPGGYLLITDFHPDVSSQGWRTMFLRPGTTYLLPNMPHTRANYLEALIRAGFKILKLIDAHVRDVPDGYFSEAMIRDHGDKLFCLIVLAQK